jgi:hypothetical protein
LHVQQDPENKKYIFTAMTAVGSEAIAADAAIN